MANEPTYDYTKFTNSTKNERRGLYTRDGFVTVGPGEEGFGYVSDGDKKANADFFDFAAAKEGDAPQALDEADRLNPVDPPVIDPDADKYAAMSDDMLRDEIEDKTSKRPHHNTSRAKLIEQHKAL